MLQCKSSHFKRHVAGINSIKKLQVYFTIQTLVFTNSHQFESTKSPHKFPLEASNLYLQWCSIGFNQLKVEHLHANSVVVKNYTCSLFIQLAPVVQLKAFNGECCTLGSPEKMFPSSTFRIFPSFEMRNELRGLLFATRALKLEL